MMENSTGQRIGVMMSDYNEEVLEAIYEELLESGYSDCPETSEYAYTLFLDRAI